MRLTCVLRDYSLSPPDRPSQSEGVDPFEKSLHGMLHDFRAAVWAPISV